MKTMKKFVNAVNKAINFVDIFGNNLGGATLIGCVELTTEQNKLVIKNRFGAVKSYEFVEENSRQIYEEIAEAIKEFKPNYPGYVSIHQGKHGDKVITTLSSQIYLNDRDSTISRVAVIAQKGKKVTCRFEIKETFVEVL